MKKIGNFIKRITLSYLTAIAKAYNNEFYVYGSKY